MKLLNIILAIVAVAVGTALAVYLAGCNQRAIRAVTVSVLQQLPRSWLVLQTDEEMAVAEVRGGGLLLGPRSGMAVAVRRTHWGLDLEKVVGEDIVVSGREVRVKLPVPAVFDTVVDMSTFRCMTRRSGFHALGDVLWGRSLFSELAEIACRTPPKYTSEQIQARRSDFILRLNEQAKALFEARDLHVQFE